MGKAFDQRCMPDIAQNQLLAGEWLFDAEKFATSFPDNAGARPPATQKFHTYLRNGCSKKIGGLDDCLVLAVNAICGRPVFRNMEEFVNDCLAPSTKTNKDACF